MYVCMYVTFSFCDQTDLERPACYINWCLNAEACIVLKEDGVPVNVRLAGEDDVRRIFFAFVQFIPVGKRCRDYKRADPTMLDTDQLVAKSTQPFHVG
ncbi:unnamed protein product, partial [Ectocarpus sp. 12 AP-2014]